jgi:DNA-binding transcriptional MocR family regulator
MDDIISDLDIRLDDADVPIYRQIALAVEEAVVSRRVAPGDKLPPQRHLAQALGINLTTISRAYTELQKRGIVVSGVGRGTFIRGAGPDFEPVQAQSRQDPLLIDLSINRPATNLYGERLAETLARLPSDPRYSELQEYHPAEGAIWAREAGSAWIGRSGLIASAERVIATSGAQEGIFAALSAVTRPGDVIITNQITYYGLKALANLLHLEIRGLATDKDGLLPDAIEEACKDERVRVLFTVPCLHNPTTTTVPLERREAIVVGARHARLFVIEDDVYGPLLETRPTSIAALYPERTFYITGTSKTLAPGLRVGFMTPPRDLVAATATAVRATCWMTSPLSMLIAARWIEDGTAEALLDAQRRELVARQMLAGEILKGFDFDTDLVSTHLWLHLPEPWRATDFTAQLLAHGVRVIESEVFAVGRGEIPHAVRINVSAARSREQLATGLRIIVDTLQRNARALSASFPA